MASKKNTAAGQTGASTTTDAGTDVTGTDTAATTKKGGRPPGPVFSWTDSRNEALVLILLQNNGQLSAEQVRSALIQNPDIAADAHLLTGEKIRQQAKKLSTRAQELGYPELTLKRSKATSGGMGAVLSRVFQSVGVIPLPAAPAAAQAPVAVQPVAPVAQPQPHYLHQPQSTPAGTLPGFAGGLIPTPGTGSAGS